MTRNEFKIVTVAELMEDDKPVAQHYLFGVKDPMTGLEFGNLNHAWRSLHDVRSTHPNQAPHALQAAIEKGTGTPKDLYYALH